MFTGFNEKAIDFLWGIRFNNNREWFEEHKPQYQKELYQPMRELSFSVWEQMMEQYKTLGLNCHVSRIYRDARRTHGKGPYKDRLWFTLRGDCDAWTDTPVFYFELNPESYTYGLGYYAASPGTMTRFRAGLDSDPKKFEKIARTLQRQSVFVIDGDEYKKKKAEKPPLLAAWYNRKTLGMTAERPIGDELFSADYAKRLFVDFELLVPLYRYLCAIDAQQ